MLFFERYHWWHSDISITFRLVEYKPTMLEKNFKWELLTAPDLGVRIDLINPETYYIDPHMQKRAVRIAPSSHCNCLIFLAYFYNALSVS